MTNYQSDNLHPGRGMSANCDYFHWHSRNPKDELKGKGVKGLMLSCAADNHGAIRFYKRNGFKELLTIAGGCMMGIEL